MVITRRNVLNRILAVGAIPLVPITAVTAIAPLQPFTTLVVNPSLDELTRKVHTIAYKLYKDSALDIKPGDKCYCVV